MSQSKVTKALHRVPQPQYNCTAKLQAFYMHTCMQAQGCSNHATCTILYVQISIYSYISYVVTFHLNTVVVYQVLCHFLYNHQFQTGQLVDKVVVQVKKLPNK